MEHLRLLELAGIAKGPTIADATERNGNINRTTSDRIIDPRGYFAKNKRKSRKKVREMAPYPKNETEQTYRSVAQTMRQQAAVLDRIWKNSLDGREDAMRVLDELRVAEDMLVRALRVPGRGL